jgi:ADP-ribose pyrophosphatase
MKPVFHQQDVEIVNDEKAYKGFFSLRKLMIRHRLFDGGWTQTFSRELCVRGDAVGVLLYDPHLQQFALVEQLRIGAIGRECSPWLLELVAGMLDKEHENPVEVARRETFEEAGLQVQDLHPMLNYFCSPGGSTEYFSLFCGKVDLNGVVDAVFGLPEEHEDIRLHIVSVNDAINLLQSGSINNAMTIIALQWFQLHKNILDAKWLR